MSALDAKSGESGVLMSGPLVKKGKRSYLSTARHCALTRDCFIYTSGEVRRVPVLDMQVSVARESFTIVDCSGESFTFRCQGKNTADRQRDVQAWTQKITTARGSQHLVRKAVLKRGKGRDSVLVNTWLTDSCIITAEPYKTGTEVIVLSSVTEILPVPLEPALVMHTKGGQAMRLTMSTEKHQAEWIGVITELIQRAKLKGDVDAFGADHAMMPQDIEAEMHFDALAKQMRAAVVAFYQQHAPAKVNR